MPLLETIGSGSARGLGLNSFGKTFPLGYGQYGLNNSWTNSGTTGGMVNTANATFTTSPVKFGSHSLSLDGVGDYATFDIANNSYTHTIAFWIYPRDTSERSYIIDHRFSDAPDVGYWLYDNTGTATYGGTSEFTFNFTPTLNTWAHWAMVTDQASGTMTWYQNGTVLSSASRGCKTTGRIALGTYFGVIGSNQSQYFMNAAVDNLYISSEALTATQVQELYNSQVSF
jgi:hypothetical protein